MSRVDCKCNFQSAQGGHHARSFELVRSRPRRRSCHAAVAVRLRETKPTAEPGGIRDHDMDGAGIPQSSISGIEIHRIAVGLERARVLARALGCHPAVLVFPDWDVAKESVAREEWMARPSSRALTARGTSTGSGSHGRMGREGAEAAS